MSLSTILTHLLNPFRDGDSTTGLGRLLLCLTTLSVKRFSLIAKPNLPWQNWRLLLLVVRAR